MIFSAISDAILNSDALKNNEGDEANVTWKALVKDLNYSEDGDDNTNVLRRRWVLGSMEWMSGKNGSKQNDKELFDYTDDEWEYIWSTMMEDGAWAVPDIKDSLGNNKKANFAPEIMIKFIAHDIRCHIIICDLLLDTVHFLSANHVQDGNVAFDSPLIIYYTGTHYQAVFQKDHEFFIQYAKELEQMSRFPESSPDMSTFPTDQSQVSRNPCLIPKGCSGTSKNQDKTEVSSESPWIESKGKTRKKSKDIVEEKITNKQKGKA